MNLYYSPPSEQKDPAFTVRSIVHGTCRASGQVTTYIALGDASAREVAIKGTPYRLALQRFEPDWSAAGEPSAMALVRVSGGARPFLRTVVAPRSDLTQDLDVNGQRLPGLADPTLEITLENIAPSGLTIAGSDGGAHALLVSNGGRSCTSGWCPVRPPASLTARSRSRCTR